MKAIEQKCKYCGKPVKSDHPHAEVSHWDCIYKAVKPVRDALKRIDAKR